MSETKNEDSGLMPLLSADGYTNFLIKVDGDTECSMEFEVFEVTAWECDDANTPSGLELYMTGIIKWDGCSHVWFGEKDNDGQRDGYLHLCGKTYWERHAELMRAVYISDNQRMSRDERQNSSRTWYRKMSNKTCGTCKNGLFDQTPTGRPKRNKHGVCKMAVELREHYNHTVIAPCIIFHQPGTVAIFPNYEANDCPMYEDRHHEK